MVDILRRDMAPIVDEAWQEIELQSSRLLKGNLSGRKLVDFKGPHGWTFAAVNLGRLEVGAEDAVPGVAWGLHKVLPLVEIRVPFTLQVWELDDMARGAKNPDLSPMLEAARKVAVFEETALYRGFGGAGIQGMLEGSSHAPVPLSADRSKLTESVELALLAIQEAEIGGPFALVLGTEPYKWLMAGEPSAYPLRERIKALVTGGIHWSPVLGGGAVLSRRGGDFEMTVGQDVAIGYKMHTAREVELYFAESFTFRVLEPAAAVELKLKAAPRSK
ncbi:family 1 encapsulin nanocompartment shell protein [Geothrix edaphica]|uniref:Bacteriocin n=1 Tax=Geothrix edaphica TaxID=2927976 RepID=A0ABQ5PZE3_9BACT|nr:family 1 encapsulin nanocompartment shell protein [Geothrix edaphica]GLH67436.1 bacteriocin [Geothrix edaphica]